MRVALLSICVACGSSGNNTPATDAGTDAPPDATVVPLGCSLLGLPSVPAPRVGLGPSSIARVDLDGDARPDLVTANAEDDTISVLLSRGDGTYTDQLVFATGDKPTAIAIGDVNGDALLDAVTANAEADTVSVLLGNGDGTFQAKTDIAVGPDPGGVALGNLTADTNLDIVVTSFSNAAFGAVSLLRGNGNGTFQARSDFDVVRPKQLSIEDMNGDDSPDLVFTKDNTVSVMVNVNAGIAFAESGGLTTGSTADGFAIADLDGNGFKDLIGISFNDQTLSVTLATAPNVYSTPDVYSVTGRPTAVAVGDMTGDGKLDVIVTVREQLTATSRVTVFSNAGAGTFPTSVEYTGGILPTAIVAADLDGDAATDLALANGGSDHVSVMLARSGSFPQRFETRAVGAGPIVVDDFDGDTISDLAILDPVAGTVGVAIGAGDGTFARPVDTAFGNFPTRLSAADVDGDLRPDLIAVVGEELAILRNTGNSFTPLAPVAIDPATNAYTVSDVNNDGKADLLAATYSPALLSIALGNGDGTFGASTTVATSQFANALGLADFNGDRIPDLVVAGDGAVGIMAGMGNGTFLPPVLLDSPLQGSSLAIADFDGDQRVDIAVAGIDSVNVYRNQGSLAFSAHELPAALFMRGVIATDMNADGRPDLVVLGGTGVVAIAIGLGDGTFGRFDDYEIGVGFAHAVGDFDRDGRIDVVGSGDARYDVLLQSDCLAPSL